MNNKVIFISWTSHARHSELLGKALGAKMFYVKNFIKSRGIFWKVFFLFDYLSKSIRSFKIIRVENPAIVFVQNPPSFAPIVLAFIKKFKKIKIAVDSHNGAFEKPWVSIPLHKWALRNSDIVIVHNKNLYSNLINNHYFKNINFKILNSRLSDFTSFKNESLTEKYFLVVTTFAGDEPVDEMMEGIREFNKQNSSSINFKVTGNYKKQLKIYEEYSNDPGIEFLGYVSEEEYNSQFVNAFGIISLSTRDDVQQFALMEAVGAEVPFISSKNSTNLSLFNNQMILTENTATGLTNAIVEFIGQRENLKSKILEIKKAQESRWYGDFKEVKSFLGIN